MSYIKNLSVAFTNTEKTDILTALDTALSILNGVQIVTLTPEQRKELPSVNEGRFPYVLKAVSQLGPSYPDLVGKAVSTANAQQATESFTFINEVDLKLKELADRAVDLGLNLENTAYNYTLDLYYTAKRYTDDLPGADVVVSELETLFERHTVNNAPSPTPTP